MQTTPKDASPARPTTLLPRLALVLEIPALLALAAAVLLPESQFPIRVGLFASAAVLGLGGGVIGLVAAIKMPAKNITAWAAAVVGVVALTSVILAAPATLWPASSAQNLVYSVIGPARHATVSYSEITPGAYQLKLIKDVKLPFTVQLHVDQISSRSYRSFAVGGKNGANDKGTLACTIALDGRQIAHATAHGPNATVSCAPTNRR
jgi:hypothetical protein